MITIEAKTSRQNVECVGVRIEDCAECLGLLPRQLRRHPRILPPLANGMLRNSRERFNVSNKRSIHWRGGMAQRAAELVGDGAGALRPVTAAGPPGDGGDSPAWSRKRGSYQPPELDRPRTSVRYAELHAHFGVQLPRRREYAGRAGRGGGPAQPAGARTDRSRRSLRGGAVRRGGQELDVATVFGAELSLGNVPAPRIPTRPARICWCWPAVRKGIDGCPREISKAHLAGGEKGKPRYDFDELTEAAGGHWHILTGCRKGHVRQALSTGWAGSCRRRAGGSGGPVRGRPGQYRARPSRPPV